MKWFCTISSLGAPAVLDDGITKAERITVKKRKPGANITRLNFTKVYEHKRASNRTVILQYLDCPHAKCLKWNGREYQLNLYTFKQKNNLL